MKLGSTSGLLTPKPGSDPIIGRIDRAAELELSVIGIGFRQNREPGYMRSVAEAAAKKGIELRLGGGGSFGSANPEERKAAVERNVEYLLEVNRHTGIKFSSLANLPMTHTRWSPEPPMDERIDMIAENLGKVADAVASVGIVLGLENHCDYRGYECAAMLEKANRPNLKAQLDTGNAFTVFEEPVDCAKALVKWTVSCHLKDVKVTPFTVEKFMGTTGENAPLGGGMVDNLAICKILQEQSPDPKSLALLVEPLTGFPSDEAREEYLQISLSWAREKLAPFL